MGGIFLSYRREDSSGYAIGLYDRLRKRFPKHPLFMDIDTLEPGLDFREVIEQAVGSCDVLIALIGKNWLVVNDEEGHRRLDNPNDWVRLEIQTALQRGIRVIPTLVGGAKMPKAEALPGPLANLAGRHALEVSDTRFHTDADRLIRVVKKVVQVPPPRMPLPKILSAIALIAGLVWMVYLAIQFLPPPAVETGEKATPQPLPESSNRPSLPPQEVTAEGETIMVPVPGEAEHERIEQEKRLAEEQAALETERKQLEADRRKLAAEQQRLAKEQARREEEARHRAEPPPVVAKAPTYSEPTKVFENVLGVSS